MKTQVICKRAEKNGAEGGALEDPLRYGTRSGCFNLAIRASEADTLCVTVQVILKPRNVYTERPKLFQKFSVVNNVKTFAEINQTE